MSGAAVRQSMPAEWSRHHATWVSWPHNRETWPGVLAEAEQAMAEVVAALAPNELVYVNVCDAAHERHVRRRLRGRVADDRLRIERIATDDAWIRDYGAIIVSGAIAVGGFAALDFDYNAWGGKYPPYDKDRAVARQMAERLGVPCVPAPMVLEGGSVDVNGEGIGLVTEQCLLNPNRNPGLSRSDIESDLNRLLGLRELVWLGEGIVGDDTDGHVDNLARFVDRRNVLAVTTSDKADPDFAALAENRRRLDEFRDSEGLGLVVRALPLPPPIVRSGVRLPASYANFYIANNVVLVPAYAVVTDDLAQGILAESFPGRRVVPIDCRALIVGLGALHCLTQQIPVIVPCFEPEE